MKRTSNLILAAGLLAAAASAHAQSDSHACSNRSLKGRYGFHVEGLLLTDPGGTITGAIPLRGVAMTEFDGKGGLSQVDHVVVAGQPPTQEWTPATGTYSVNPDCTGTAQIVIPGDPFSPVNLKLVVTSGGREVRTVVGVNAVTSTGVRVE